MPLKDVRLLARLRALLSRLGPDGYEPARHYMRGPGPKSRAAAKSRAAPKSGPANTPEMSDAAKPGGPGAS